MPPTPAPTSVCWPWASPRVAWVNSVRRARPSTAPSRPIRRARRRWSNGGVLFLEGRYEDAARDLARALGLREEAYTRDLLASALQLAGRSDEALRVWNQAGLPIVQSLRIEGLSHTKDPVARRELRLAPGDVLDVGRLRESRAGLDEVGVFDRITLRPIPVGEGKADLEVALLERHGFGAPTELLVGGGVGALQKVLRLRYSNLSGSGMTLGGLYRWQENRPEARLFLTWPRPFGLPVYFQIQGMRGRQVYETFDRFESRYRGAQAGVRKVLGARTVAEIGLFAQNRKFSDGRGAATPGALVEWRGAVERRWVEARRIRFLSSLQYARATAALGSVVDSSNSWWGRRSSATFRCRRGRFSSDPWWRSRYGEAGVAWRLRWTDGSRPERVRRWSCRCALTSGRGMECSA